MASTPELVDSVKKPLASNSSKNRPRPGLRRISSMTATKEDLTSGGPVVVVPERLILSRSQSYHAGFAASMEAARVELQNMNLEDESPELSSPSTTGTPATPSSPLTPAADAPSADSFAFAFDIDGVLIRGGRPIPEAIEAMKILNGENEYGVKMYDSLILYSA